jgi:hypothetical protein
VVQLGDLGHFGQDGSPTADTLCYKYVTDNRWCDIVLWGNHDRAEVDSSHSSRGFLKNYDACTISRSCVMRVACAWPTPPTGS